jgi:hypothetical protein
MLRLARLGGLPMRGLPPAMMEEDKRGWCDKRQLVRRSFQTFDQQIEQVINKDS